MGLVTPKFLKEYRKYALVLVLVLAAVITPPDIISQIIVAIPMIALYEASIKISARIIKNEKKKKDKEFKKTNKPTPTKKKRSQIKD
jgi:sec-independent protein translocase protein TatC